VNFTLHIKNKGNVNITYLSSNLTIYNSGGNEVGEVEFPPYGLILPLEIISVSNESWRPPYDDTYTATGMIDYSNETVKNRTHAFQKDFSVIDDDDKPDVFISSPLPIWHNTTPINLTFQVTDDCATHIYCEYTLDGSSAEIGEIENGSINTTEISAGEGLHLLTLNCSDFAGNWNNSSIEFGIDTSPPYFLNEHPENESYYSGLSPEISVEIMDLSGISEAKMWIDGTDVSPSREDIPGGIRIFYSPPSPFEKNERVDVKVVAVDNASNQNQTEWWFVPTNPAAEIVRFEPMVTQLMVEFDLGVNNTGMVPVEVQCYINISKDGIVESLDLGSRTIAVGDEYSTKTGWNGTAGSYEANATCYYDTMLTFMVASFTLKEKEVEVPPAVGVAAPPVAVTPPILPPPPAEIRFLRNPVLIEIIGGENLTVDLVLKNTLKRKLDVEVISPFPAEWIYIHPRSFEMEPEGRKVINLVVSPPSQAIPGDYKVVIVLEAEEVRAETFFILRVKYYPPDYDLPVSARVVELLREEGTTLVSLGIKNAERRAELIHIIEKIPKILARDPSLITTDVPFEIIEKDPIVGWRLEEFLPYESRTIDYKIPKILEEYTPYVYWPVKQITVIYRKGVPVLKVEPRAEALYPGEWGKFSLLITNTAVSPLNISAILTPPHGWEIKPPEVKKILLPEKMEEFVYSILPPGDAVVGTYTILLELSYDGEVESIIVGIMVQEFVGIPSHLLFLLFLLLLLGISFVLVLGRRQVKKTIEKLSKLDMIKRIR
jgi:hypothetical protein